VALLENGRPFRDASGQHPECGHLPVFPSGPRCYCGLIGCWEMSASRRGLEARVEGVLGSCDLEELEGLLAHGAGEAVTAAIDDYGHAIGRGLESLVIAYGPDRVVLCGSASRFLPHFSHGLRAELERSPDFRHDLNVVGSSLGDFAGAIGASMMVELRSP
jgi:glucokinase